MEKVNLPPFYVGEIVECVESVSSSLGGYVGVIHGKKYTAKCLRCPCGCGQWVVDVGVRSDRAWECNETKKLLDIRPWYFLPRRFRSLQQQNFPLIKLEQIKEKEKQEVLAAN